MTIYQWGDRWNQDGVVLALGAFDALHEGHLQVLKEANAVTLFDPLPIAFFNKNFDGLIRTTAQRIKIFESLGLKMILSIDFLSNFSKIEGNAFLDEIAKTVLPIRLLSGANFRLGYQQRWDATKIALWARSHCIDYHAVPMLSSRDGFISSSEIRSLIKAGDIENANSAMIKPYSLDLEPLSCYPSGNSLVYELNQSKQVLPPDGLYRTDAGIVSISALKLKVKNNYLIKEIGFINAFKKRS